MGVYPHRPRSLLLLLNFLTIGLIIGVSAWLDAGPNGTGQFAPALDVSGQRRLIREAPHRIPPLARSRAVAAMKAMPTLSAAAGKWTFIGPGSITNGQGLSTKGMCGAPARITVAGRISSMGFGAQGIYVGSASGGVWKSTDGGAQWTPLTDQEVSLAVGALAVVAGPPDTIYAGTGEGNNGCDNQYGQGILKSIDGGASWTQLAAATFDRLTFTKIAIQSANPQVLYAGISYGFTGGSAGECLPVSTAAAGLYKSTDTGETWALLSGSGGLPAGTVGMTSDGSGSVYDVAIDPAKAFTGPLTGTVTALAGGGCAGHATLSAVDPDDAGNPKPFKLTAAPAPGGGYVLDGTLTLTQDPAAGLNPPGICDDFSGTYSCTGIGADLNGAPTKGLTCIGGNFNKGAGTTLTLTGSFADGATDSGSFTGTWSLDAGAGPDLVTNAPISLESAPAVFAAVGGSGGGLFRSTDAGMTWTGAGAIAAGRRFAIDFAADGDRFYVASTTLTSPSSFGALYISTDHGATFAIGLGQPNIGGAGCLTEDQGDQDLALAVDPANPNHLYLGMIGVYSSTDGGMSFAYTGAGTHAGQHAIRVDGSNVYLGNDGGLFQSTDGGVNWIARNSGLGVIQFNSVGLDAGAAAIVGGTQDNGVNQSTGSLTWSHSDDGDGGSVLIDQANPAIYFDEQTGLSISRSKNFGTLGTYANISPGAAGTDPMQLYPPFTADPSNPDRILFGTIRLWETCHTGAGGVICDGASSAAAPIWTVLSADLTGGCVSSLCDISDIAVAPTNPDVIYVVTSSDGATGPMVWVTRNGTNIGPVFSNVTPSGMAGRPLTSVAVSPLDFHQVVITASGFTGGGGHVFWSSDEGASWTDISAFLPDIPALSAIFDPAAPAAGLLVGTDIGVFHSPDLGHNWSSANLGVLPIVPVYQLRQAKGIVAAATHGRGVWTFTGPVPGHPSISSIPAAIAVGGSFEIQGSGFTAGSVVNFFIATSAGVVNAGPLIPTAAWSPTLLTVDVPAASTLGQGFVALQVINTDQSFAVSNTAYALLQGSAAAGIPTVVSVNDVGLAATSADPDYAINNIETVVAQGATVKIGGTGFDTVNGVAVDLFCACTGGKVGPFVLHPGDAGLTASLISFTVPAAGQPNSPVTGPGSLVVSNQGADGSFARKSNAVSVPIGAKISLSAVSQSGTKVTVDGSGFSPLTVINLFNLQGPAVVNLGGLAGGAPAIPITLVDSMRFTFIVPPGAVPGPAYVQALSPPFVPFTSSGNSAAGAFTLD